MKLVIKRTFKIFFWISLILLIPGFIITFFFSEKIEQAVITKIQEEMTTELQLENVAFSLIEQFPATSVRIDNLLVYEKEGFDNDTLIFAKAAYIEIGIYDIIFNQIGIKKIVIADGSINIKYNAKKENNFSIFNENNEEGKQVTLEKVALLNTQIKYTSPTTNIKWEVSQALLTPKENHLNINAKLLSKNLIVNNREYVENKDLRIISTLSFLQDTIAIKEGSNLEIEDIKAQANGSIINGNKLNLNISCEKQDISSLISHTPNYLKSIYSSFIAEGKISCDGNINGLISKNTNPKFNMNFKISNANFNLKSRPFVFKNANLTGEITNGKGCNFNDTKIEVSQFKAKTENGLINGNFTLKNLNKYHLTANLVSTWDLAEVNHYFEDSPFFNLQGILKANSYYSGYLSFDSKFKNYFLNANHITDATFSNVTFKYQNFPLDFNFKAIQCKFDKNKIQINNSNITIADSDINFKGDITNLIAYILGEKNSINVEGELASTYIKFDELITLKNLSKGESENTLPNWISANLNSNISTFSYNDFIATDITGNLAFSNHTLTGESMLLNTLNGSINGDFKFYELNNQKLKLFTQLKLNKLNIRNAFLAFNNFNQDFITAKHIKGIGTAEIQLQSIWDSNFVLEEDALKLKSHLVIDKGELIHFKPLESLSDYVSIEDLKEVKFSTLENTIDINNKIINIPTMQINSSALSVFISGTHTFEQEINYNIKLLLSELLSKKFRKENTRIDKSEFGEVKENGRIFNTVYFKMTGTSDDPNISFDGIKFWEDVAKGVNNEKKTIGTIIQEDILQTKEKTIEEEGQDVIIEWEDE